MGYVLKLNLGVQVYSSFYLLLCLVRKPVELQQVDQIYMWPYYEPDPWDRKIKQSLTGISQMC